MPAPLLRHDHLSAEAHAPGSDGAVAAHWALEGDINRWEAFCVCGSALRFCLWHHTVLGLLVMTVPIPGARGAVYRQSRGDQRWRHDQRVLRQGKAVQVHLYGVACPTRGHALGAQARQFTRDVAFQQVVAVLVDSATSRSQRLIAAVQLPDGRDLSQALVQAGYAWHDSRYAPADRRLAQLEAEARAAKRGLWAAGNPTPPWQ